MEENTRSGTGSSTIMHRMRKWSGEANEGARMSRRQVLCVHYGLQPGPRLSTNCLWALYVRCGVWVRSNNFPKPSPMCTLHRLHSVGCQKYK